MSYYDVSNQWTKLDGLVRNRVDVLNVITEDRCTYKYGRGEVKVTFLGRDIAKYAFFDTQGAHDAFLKLEAVYRVLWDCRREGLASFA